MTLVVTAVDAVTKPEAWVWTGIYINSVKVTPIHSWSSDQGLEQVFAIPMNGRVVIRCPTLSVVEASLDKCPRVFWSASISQGGSMNYPHMYKHLGYHLKHVHLVGDFAPHPAPPVHAPVVRMEEAILEALDEGEDEEVEFAPNRVRDAVSRLEGH